jgi:hypothetical protein
MAAVLYVEPRGRARLPPPRKNQGWHISTPTLLGKTRATKCTTHHTRDASTESCQAAMRGRPAGAIRDMTPISSEGWRLEEHAHLEAPPENTHTHKKRKINARQRGEGDWRSGWTPKCREEWRMADGPHGDPTARQQQHMMLISLLGLEALSESAWRSPAKMYDTRMLRSRGCGFVGAFLVACNNAPSHGDYLQQAESAASFSGLGRMHGDLYTPIRNSMGHMYTRLQMGGCGSCVCSVSLNGPEFDGRERSRRDMIETSHDG